ncbi:MAG TPA: hypothetical protein VEY94_08675 [Patescibacteria group bacterium]|nr:hypothetical protein [Candidatus Baltobacteraceae bacterium]HYK65006.1 hypothetical protein [Patescibacteria group bacterium]
MLRTVTAFAVVITLLTAAAQADIKSAYGIKIESCTVNQNGGNTNGINVVYTNSNSSPATEVDFMVNYSKKRYTLTDTGTFSEGSQINHNISTDLVGVAWAGPTPKKCTVKRVVLQNGKVLGGQQ